MLGLGAKKFFSTLEIDDYTLRVAAELIDKVEGKGDRIVTEKNLRRAAEDLKAHDAAVAANDWSKSPLLKRLMPQQVEVLREGLPQLGRFLHTQERALPKPFCTSLRAEAIADDVTRETAFAVIRCFKGAKDELNTGQLLDAKREIEGYDAQKPSTKPYSSAVRAALVRGDKVAELRTKLLASPDDRKLNAELSRLLKQPCIEREEFKKIDLFMLTGMGGLISWGPVEINGRRFVDCYRLPVPDPSILQLDPSESISPENGRVWESFLAEAMSTDDSSGDSKAQGASDQPDSQAAAGADDKSGDSASAANTEAADSSPADKSDKTASSSDSTDNTNSGDGPNALDKLIDLYELRLKDTGYDRIYIREGNKLFVALNPKGSIDDVRPFYRVTMHHDHHLAASGEVVRKVDVNNSMKESTVSFWRAIISKTMSALRSAFTQRLDDNIGKTAKAVADGTPVAEGDGDNLQKMLIAGAGVGLVGTAAALNVAIAAGAVGVAATAVTAANVIDYLATPQDKAPYFHAAGVTVNVSDPVRY